MLSSLDEKDSPVLKLQNPKVVNKRRRDKTPEEEEDNFDDLSPET